MLKLKEIIRLDINQAIDEVNKFYSTIQPEQFIELAVDNGIFYITYDDQAPDKLASLNMNKVSKQPSGDLSITDHPMNSETYIDNSCEK